MLGASRDAKPSRSMRLAARIFPVDLDGRLRESWTQWTNWRTFVLLLAGPFVFIGAFTGTGLAWWVRGALAVGGAALSAILVRSIVGYRHIMATARQRGSQP
ncbi:hypothetical protein ACFV98_42165 [Streptomyces violascens]|uniref:hypothetical protein n=1 Tax=Streptomyces violascens TaxID=67381 RepID=UPI0036520554